MLVVVFDSEYVLFVLFLSDPCLLRFVLPLLVSALKLKLARFELLVKVCTFPPKILNHFERGNKDIGQLFSELRC